MLSPDKKDDLERIKFEWLRNNSIVIKDYSINYIDYAYYGKSIMFKTDIANWYVEQGFKDVVSVIYPELISDKLLVSNYSEIKYIVSSYNKDMHLLKEFIGNFDNTIYPTLNIVFKNFSPEDTNSGYYDGNVTTYNSSISMVIHEFAHFIGAYGRNPYVLEKFKVEGFALYLGNIFDTIGNEISFQNIPEITRSPKNIREKAFLETENYLGRTYQKTDTMIFNDILTYLYDDYFLQTEFVFLSSSNEAAIVSYINYLYRFNHKNEVTEYLTKQNPIILTYKTDKELQTEWENHIRTTYSSIQREPCY